MTDFIFFAQDSNHWSQGLRQLRLQSQAREYRQWAHTLAPRTCLLLQ